MYIITFFSFLVCNLGLSMILSISIPILNAIYPVSIVLILLGLSHDLWKGNRFAYPMTVAGTAAVSIAFALGDAGLPLGVLLVAGDKDGVLPLPGWLMHILNIVINILRSVPFLILMICVFPLTRAIVGTTVGTKATIVPLVVAAFPFVARLVETSLRELDEGVVEAAQSMGATPFQIITKVMIPECLPGLISSMTTALTTILGYSAMSGVIGGGGLGKIALSYGYYRYQTNIMIVCVVLLVLMAGIVR